MEEDISVLLHKLQQKKHFHNIIDIIKNLEDLPSLSEIRDLDELNNVLNLGDEEGLGEKDDEIIPDVPTVIAEASAITELEEFVDGEDAFVDADDETVVEIEEAVLPQTSTELSADVALDEDENTHEETNNV